MPTFAYCSDGNSNSNLDNICISTIYWKYNVLQNFKDKQRDVEKNETIQELENKIYNWESKKDNEFARAKINFSRNKTISLVKNGLN